MENLKSLFKQGPDSNCQGWFESIARLLMIGYEIETAVGKYRIKEIEFYYYSDSHPDETTYGFIKEGKHYSPRILRHKNAQRIQGSWFFHYSGIDLVFGDENNPGGILIRTIERENPKEEIKGPLVVLLELMNQGADMEGQNNFKLILSPAKVEINGEIYSRKRVGLGEGEFKSAHYNFSLE